MWAVHGDFCQMHGFLSLIDVNPAQTERNHCSQRRREATKRCEAQRSGSQLTFDIRASTGMHARSGKGVTSVLQTVAEVTDVWTLVSHSDRCQYQLSLSLSCLEIVETGRKFCIVFFVQDSVSMTFWVLLLE